MNMPGLLPVFSPQSLPFLLNLAARTFARSPDICTHVLPLGLLPRGSSMHLSPGLPPLKVPHAPHTQVPNGIITALLSKPVLLDP